MRFKAFFSKQNKLIPDPFKNGSGLLRVSVVLSVLAFIAIDLLLYSGSATGTILQSIKETLLSSGQGTILGSIIIGALIGVIIAGTNAHYANKASVALARRNYHLDRAKHLFNLNQILLKARLAKRVGKAMPPEIEAIPQEKRGLAKGVDGRPLSDVIHEQRSSTLRDLRNFQTEALNEALAYGPFPEFSGLPEVLPTMVERMMASLSLADYDNEDEIRNAYRHLQHFIKSINELLKYERASASKIIKKEDLPNLSYLKELSKYCPEYKVAPKSMDFSGILRAMPEREKAIFLENQETKA